MKREWIGFLFIIALFFGSLYGFFYYAGKFAEGLASSVSPQVIYVEVPASVPASSCCGPRRSLPIPASAIRQIKDDE